MSVLLAALVCFAPASLRAQDAAARHADIEDRGPGGACAITRGGRVRCWHEETGGRPEWVPGLERITRLSLWSDARAFYALRADGAVFERRRRGREWQLERVASDAVDIAGTYALQRDGSLYGLLAPVADGGRGYRTFDAGGQHLCVVRRDRRVACGTREGGLTTVADVSGAVDVAVTERYGCAIVGGGEVRCWGEVEIGRRSPSAVAVPGLRDVVQLALDPFEQACARTRDGAIHCWRSNVDHVIDGDLDRHDRVWPPRRLEGIDDAVDVAVTPGRVCAVRANGEAACRGRVIQFGPAHLSGLPDTRQLAPYGPEAMLALTEDDELFFWGVNASWTSATPVRIARGVRRLHRTTHDVWVESTDGTVRRLVRFPDSSTVGEDAFEAPLERDDVEEVAGGPTTLCVRTRSRRVYCRGSNAWGAFPRRGVEHTDEWTRVRGLPPADELVGSADGFCIRSGTAAHCWGRPLSWSGHGDPSPEDARPPHRMPGRFSRLQGGFRRVLATREDGGVEVWGQIGAGGRGRWEVPDSEGAVEATLSGIRSVVLVHPDGTVSQVHGDGRSVPLSTPPRTVAVAQMRSGRCALDADGRVFCEGDGEALGTAAGDRWQPVGRDSP